MKVGVFGGSFDPIHLGHVRVAEGAMVQLGLNKILFIPAFRPWMKEEPLVASAKDRLRMLDLMVGSRDSFEVSPIEIERGGTSYTVDTMEQLKAKEASDTEFFLILGMDAARQINKWRAPAEVLSMSKLVVVPRPGYQDQEEILKGLINTLGGGEITFLTGTLVDISSTEIRRKIGKGEPIKQWVPPSVENYINSRDLYGKE